MIIRLCVSIFIERRIIIEIICMYMYNKPAKPGKLDTSVYLMMCAVGKSSCPSFS